MNSLPTTAWNLVYEAGERGQFSTVEHIDLPAIPPAGWSGNDGPAIAPQSWPRSPESGLPMRHALTLYLPGEYLCRGPEFPGIAIFQGDTERERLSETEHAAVLAGTAPPEVVPDTCGLGPYKPHPQLVTAQAPFAKKRFALIWLTAEELAPGPVPPPADTRGTVPAEAAAEASGEHGVNAWDHPHPQRKVWLIPRKDPNVGKPMTPSPNADGTGYQDAHDPNTWELKRWAAAPGFEYANHLGGTYMQIDWVPSLSPYFLQLNNLAGFDLRTMSSKNGILAIDLQSGEFHHIG
ncbi:MAG: hypothetical protein ACTHXA_04315 [Gulosibacter sp.]|uniref:hypothetical protein n=1 Tax=Gulosibacter sp. TaxID=2817531 RepID=UPI003F92D420